MIFRSTYQTIRDSIRKISAGYGIMWFAHILHGAFQNEHKNAKWNVNTALRSFYKLFHDSQARQADYQKTNDSSVFPMKFCTNSCAENVKQR